MMFAISALEGGTVEASDGEVGTVKDILFDDEAWRIRWVVVDTGTWLTGRKVLIHPSAIEPLDLKSQRRLPMMGAVGEITLSVRLTKRQIEASPPVSENAPLSQQVESQLYEFYGWDQAWGASYFGAGETALLSTPSYVARVATDEGLDLRSVKTVIDAHVHATDGDIGHAENLLADDVRWDVRYLIVATSNWWFGKHVLLSPYAVDRVGWSDSEIYLNVTRDQVKSSPPWDPMKAIERIDEERLHGHYGWRGYGW
jgi:hypothetical protein